MSADTTADLEARARALGSDVEPDIVHEALSVISADPWVGDWLDGPASAVLKDLRAFWRVPTDANRKALRFSLDHL